MSKIITGPIKSQIRAELRKLLKAGRLEYRRTYYDYYDSCHAPVETPNAEFKPIDDAWLKESILRDLYAGGPSISVVGAYQYSFFTDFQTYELRVRR